MHTTRLKSRPPLPDAGYKWYSHGQSRKRILVHREQAWAHVWDGIAWINGCFIFKRFVTSISYLTGFAFWWSNCISIRIPIYVYYMLPAVSKCYLKAIVRCCSGTLKRLITRETMGVFCISLSSRAIKWKTKHVVLTLGAVFLQVSYGSKKVWFDQASIRVDFQCACNSNIKCIGIEADP